MKLEFESNGTTYTMEFDRKSAEFAERNLGLNWQEFSEPTFTMMQDLFYASFIKHHPNMKRTTADAFFENFSDKSGLFEHLLTMYSDTIESLFAEPEKGKAIHWKTVD